MILSASAMDYTLAKALPNVNVTAVKTRSPRGPDLSSKQHADMLVAHLQEAGKAAQWTLVATQPSKLAGRDALQIAARLEAGGQKACQVQRQGFHGGRIYTLTLTYAGHDTARALAAMAKIARRCVFLPAAATRPAATQAASTQRKAQP